MLSLKLIVVGWNTFNIYYLYQHTIVIILVLCYCQFAFCILRTSFPCIENGNLFLYITFLPNFTFFLYTRDKIINMARTLGQFQIFVHSNTSKFVQSCKITKQMHNKNINLDNIQCYFNAVTSEVDLITLFQKSSS